MTAPRTTSERSKKVLVTVGTTYFDELIAAVCTEECIRALASKGYESLTAQVGTGVAPASFKSMQIFAKSIGFALSIVNYIDDLAERIVDYGLVISHAGAGSVFETLRLGPRAPFLLVVVNERLMDNHQRELAEELAARGYLRWCVPSGLLTQIRALDDDGAYARENYERGEYRLREHLDKLLFS